MSIEFPIRKLREGRTERPTSLLRVTQQLIKGRPKYRIHILSVPDFLGKTTEEALDPEWSGAERPETAKSEPPFMVFSVGVASL